MRIGLALGGGGAKGLAHIPILEVLDFDRAQDICDGAAAACGELRERLGALRA
jgi:hypothetical protein